MPVVSAIDERISSDIPELSVRDGAYEVVFPMQRRSGTVQSKQWEAMEVL